MAVALARTGYNMSGQRAVESAPWWNLGDFALSVLGLFGDHANQ